MVVISNQFPRKNYKIEFKKFLYYESTYLKVLSIEEIVRRKMVYSYAN